MDYKNFMQSSVSKKVIYGLCVFIVAIFIFQAGVFVGFKKASFSYRSGDNFHSIFGFNERGRNADFGGMMGRNGMMGFSRDEFTSAYGANGIIVKVDLPTIIISNNDKVEKVVLIDNKTIIRRFRSDITSTDLKGGDRVVVMGTPNDKAQISARLIRVFSSDESRVATTSAQKSN